MGTDIHMAVEALGSDGIWAPAPVAGVCRTCGGTGCKACDYRCAWYDDRNYDVFAILAGVRNGTGFAGCDTGEGFVPISSPRGLPVDLSPSLRSGNNLGDHSYSWLLAQEIHEYDWSRETIKRGWIDAWTFEKWRKAGSVGAPASWCGSVEGRMIEHVSPAYMGKIIDSGEIQWEGEEHTQTGVRHYSTGLGRAMADWPLPAGSVGAEIRDRSAKYWCQVEWRVTYAQAAEHFLVWFRSSLGFAPPERIRLVFGFDS